MSFALVALGLCFFFNPYFAVVDFFPDFIGCFLVWLGLSRVARNNSVMQEARTAFLKLLALQNQLKYIFQLQINYHNHTTLEIQLEENILVLISQEWIHFFAKNEYQQGNLI